MAIDKTTVFVKPNKTGNLLNSEWLRTYNEFRKFQVNSVKIFKIKNNRIFMENLSNRYPYTLESIIIKSDDQIYQNLIKNYFSIISSIFIFASKNNFFYNDPNLTNFLADKNGNLILIDPESFVFIDYTNIFECKYKMLRSFIDIEKFTFDRLRKNIDR